MSVVLSCRRADGRDRKEAADRAEVSRGRSASRDRVAGWEGPNVKRDQGTGTARCCGLSGLRSLHAAFAGYPGPFGSGVGGQQQGVSADRWVGRPPAGFAQRLLGGPWSADVEAVLAAVGISLTNRRMRARIRRCGRRVGRPDPPTRSG